MKPVTLTVAHLTPVVLRQRNTPGLPAIGTKGWVYKPENEIPQRRDLWKYYVPVHFPYLEEHMCLYLFPDEVAEVEN